MAAVVAKNTQNIYNCKFCNKGYVYEKCLDRHILKEHSERNNYNDEEEGDEYEYEEFESMNSNQNNGKKRKRVDNTKFIENYYSEDDSDGSENDTKEDSGDDSDGSENNSREEDLEDKTMCDICGKTGFKNVSSHKAHSFECKKIAADKKKLAKSFAFNENDSIICESEYDESGDDSILKNINELEMNCYFCGINGNSNSHTLKDCKSLCCKKICLRKNVHSKRDCLSTPDHGLFCEELTTTSFLLKKYMPNKLTEDPEYVFL